MTDHYASAAEKIGNEIVEKVSRYSHVDQIYIYNILIDRLDDELRMAMQQEYNISDDDWND